MVPKQQNVGTRAPEFPSNLEWLNSKPLTMKSLRGKVVLIDFWTYSCVNCLRTLPHVRRWNAVYKEKGLVVIGVHTPEFAFEGVKANVEAAVNELWVNFSVVLDPDREIWDLYTNHWWPRKLLIDHNGKIVYDHVGEGGYEETEKAIQNALRSSGAKSFPKIDALAVGTDEVCHPLTPETYLGYERGNYANRNVEARHTITYRKTKGRDDMPSLEGTWNVDSEFAVSKEGALHMPYMAGEVNLVMDPNGHERRTVVIEKDGKPLLHTEAGDDVSFEQEKSVVYVDSPRMYRLILSDRHHEGVLTLRAPEGTRLYAFTFGGACD
jgi:thiol-disulfide isomerase/thioredoxin